MVELRVGVCRMAGGVQLRMVLAIVRWAGRRTGCGRGRVRSVWVRVYRVRCVAGVRLLGRRWTGWRCGGWWTSQLVCQGRRWGWLVSGGRSRCIQVAAIRVIQRVNRVVRVVNRMRVIIARVERLVINGGRRVCVRFVLVVRWAGGVHGGVRLGGGCLTERSAVHWVGRHWRYWSVWGREEATR